MIGVFKTHWFWWMRLHIHLRFVVLSGVYKTHVLYMQRHYFDCAPVTVYRYFEDEPDVQKMLRLDW